MHTLYAIPLACSFAVHATLALHNIPVTVRWVPRGPKRQAGGDAYQQLNPKRKVPTLVRPNGEVLTEMVGICHHLYTTPDSTARRRHLEWLSFFNSELHQQVLAPLFDPDAPQEHRHDVTTRLLPTALDPVAEHLAERTWLTDSADPTPADLYLAWCLMLLAHGVPDSLHHRPLNAFLARTTALPTVAATLAIERHARARA